MACGGGDGNRMGPSFDLPDEILSVIPTDPYDQLDLARKITSMAIASRVTNLEAEAGSLRRKIDEKDRLIQELEDKVSCLERAYQDADLRLRIAQEDNMKLLREKDSLASTAKKLSRDLGKLETFKRQLMQSLNEDNSPQTETVGIGTYDQSVETAYSRSVDEESNGYRSHYSYSSSTNSTSMNDDVSKQAASFSTTPYRTSRFTPTGTPKVTTNVCSMGYSSAGSPTSGAGSPKTEYERQGSLSSLFPWSQQSSATNSPPWGRPLSGARILRVDGKEFFRQARSRLSLEQFSAFLANIKEFNAQRQSREETLRKAEEIFGTDGKDLYVSFQGLLNRKMQ